MANTTTTTTAPATAKPAVAPAAKATRPQRLRWHPARLLYVFVVTLVVGIVYSEVQAVLADPSSALDPTQLQNTFFWHLAQAYPAYFAAACVLAVVAAVLGWRVERRYAAVQAEQRHQETAATAQVVAEQVVQRAQAGQLGSKAVPYDLPPRAPGFVGRQQDLATVTAALRPTSAQAESGSAVALVGMGGLGKSSLAAEAVHTLATQPDAFSGGITWVRCDERIGLEGATWIEDQLLSAWGAALPAEATARAQTREEGLAMREQALRKRLGPQAPSPSLALLDNVEPDLPLARVLDTLRPLGVVTLVTTRVEPSSPHIRLITLDVLDTEAGTRLFAERYADRGGTWDVARDTTPATQVADALGGLPLAIELAAARAARTRLPLARLADELRAPDALARLNDPRDPSAGVRYSLRKTLLALSPSQRVRFAALGLPEGPDWPQSVIERMFSGVPTIQDGIASAPDDLEVMVAYSLVGLVQEAAAGDVPRVRLHPLVRELAREEWSQLPAAEQSAALSALLSGLEDWVAQHRLSTDVTEFTSTIQALSRDEDLFSGALRTAVARHEALRQVIDLVEAWSAYLFHNGRWQLSHDMHALQLECARTLGDHHAELDALTSLGKETSYMGRAKEGDRYDQEALALARSLGDKGEIIRLLGSLGVRAASRGDRAAAEAMYMEASALAREPGSHLTEFATLNNLASLAQNLGHMNEAERLYRAAVEIALAAGNPDGMLALHNLGFAYTEEGDVAAAQATFEVIATIQAAAFADMPRGGPVALNMLGQLAITFGDLEAASRDLGDALRQFVEHGMADNVLQARGNLALVRGIEAQRKGERLAAEQAFAEAVALFEQTGGNATASDQRPFARHLLDELRNPSKVTALDPSQVSPEVSAERVEYVRRILALVQSASSQSGAAPDGGVA